MKSDAEFCPTTLRRSGQGIIRSLGRFTSAILPLESRQQIAEWVERKRLPGAFQLSLGLLDDVRKRDPGEFHRFLWSRHLAYAETYDVAERFGEAKLDPTRKILFQEIQSYFTVVAANIESICELGCSLGYLLRYLETDVFPDVKVFHGIDIDERAIETGNEHLGSLHSRVRLFVGDMEKDSDVLGMQKYDLVLCCGVLMYVDESAATRVVENLLARAGRLVGIICLGHSSETESLDGASVVRGSDGTYVHDVPRMIREAGGNLVFSRWVGSEGSRRNPSYVLLAEPRPQRQG